MLSLASTHKCCYKISTNFIERDVKSFCVIQHPQDIPVFLRPNVSARYSRSDHRNNSLAYHTNPNPNLNCTVEIHSYVSTQPLPDFSLDTLGRPYHSSLSKLRANINGGQRNIGAISSVLLVSTLQA